MAVNFDKVAKRVWQILKSRGYSLEMFKENGEYAFDPEKEARRFFVKDEGIMVTINESGDHSEIRMYINDEHDLDDVKTLINSLNQAASYYGILINIEKFGKQLVPKDFAFLAYKAKKEEEEMSESIEILEAKDVSRMRGTSRSSTQNIGKPTRIIIRHNKPVDENKFAARSRYIDKIFVETHEGERLKFPVNYLQGARAMARHISEGGVWDDGMGSHIRNMCVEMSKLKAFAKNKPINETASDIMMTVKERIASIALEAKKLQGPMSYRRIAENFEESETLSEESLYEEMSYIQGMFPNASSDMLEAVANLTHGSNVLDEEEQEVVEHGAQIEQSALDEFIDWAENYSLNEEDDEEESGQDEFINDFVDDPGLKNDIKDNPRKLNKYIKK